MALLAGLLALALSFVMAVPLRKLAVAARSVGQGQLEALPKLRGSAEIDLLAYAFGQMVDDLRAARAAVAERQATLEMQVRERTAALEQTLAELRASAAEREQLNATVRELASPIIPVLQDIVVMPLIGIIDEYRASNLINTLLRGVEHYRARIVILDVTGVPVIDTDVARTLLDAASAVKLLGTQTVLVGLRPELAQTIVGLGVDLRNLMTLSDLQSGISYAMALRSS